MLLFIAFTTTHVDAQDGPGGIQATNGSSDMILWLDANAIDSVFDKNNVSTWYDQSGYGNHFAQSTADGKPNWYEDEVNGYPAIRFDGGERLEATFTGGLGADLTIFAVAYFENANQGSNDNDYVFSVGSQTGNNTMANIARYRSDASNGDKFYSYDGSNSNFGPVLNGQQWYTFKQVHNSAATYHELSLDGASETVGSAMTNALSTNADARIADWADSPNQQYYLEGRIAEIILFDRVLTTVEDNVLHSYLGAKYEISMDNDQYTGDDNGNGDHDHDVIGIGTESDGSHTSSTAGGLLLSQSSNFGNGDYLVAGHDALVNDVNTSDVGGGYAARWERTWWFDLTDAGSVMAADISFDLSESGLGGSLGSTASNYKLVYRSTGAGNWTTVASASSISGDRVHFIGVSLSADGNYTLATLNSGTEPVGDTPGTLGCDGPGGIGSTDGTSDLELWLNPERLNGSEEDPVVTFYDFSGNGNHANEFASANIPSIKADVTNGMDGVRFDGNDYIQGDLGQSLSADATIVAVCTFLSDQGSNDNDYAISLGNPTTANRHLSIGRRKNDVASDANKYYSWDGSNARLGPVISTGSWNTFYQEQHSSSSFHQLYLNGVGQSVTDYSSSFAATATDYRIGMWLSGGDNGLNGDVGEVIIYDRLLNTAERNILHSYLGAKFGMSVTNDKYTGDDGANGDHDRDVAGVGTESDGSNTQATSAGMRLEQSSGFGNGDYVVFGHNVEINQSQDTDVGHGSETLDERWERTWWIDITDASTTVEVDITFDYSEAGILHVFPGGEASNYHLIFRSGSSGNWSSTAVGSNISGDQVTFSSVSLSSDGYYTLATLESNSSPLPVQLINFSVSLSRDSEDPVVNLGWTTASEVNNDFFTLERSADGKLFEEIGMVDGSGQSKAPLTYHWVDHLPKQGVSYYRLKQWDFDQQVHISPTRSVEVPFDLTGWSVHPNPASEQVMVTLESDSRCHGAIVISSLLGHVLAQQDAPLSDGDQSFIVPVSNLSPGCYLLYWQSDRGEVSYQTRLVVR